MHGEGLFLKVPFNIIISGITNCGKTEFVLDLLTSEYMHYYDYVVIIGTKLIIEDGFTKT